MGDLIVGAAAFAIGFLCLAGAFITLLIVMADHWIVFAAVASILVAVGVGALALGPPSGGDGAA